MRKDRVITYQAAKSVAEALEKHFKSHISSASESSKHELAHVPSINTIQAIIDTAFWTSLRREEGMSPKISIAWLPPEQATRPMLFENPFFLNSSTLAKLGPGIERPGIHLGVWQNNDELYVWGTTRFVPSLCFVVDVPEPGLLVVKHRRLDSFGKFANVAVLKGDEIKLVDEDSVSMPDCPSILTTLLGLNSPSTWNSSVNVLVQLAVSMRAHGQGGSLLVVPSSDDSWQSSIIHPVTFTVKPAYTELTEIMSRDVSERKHNQWQDELQRAVDAIAGLTAIDGATIISDTYELLAFGVKIGRREGMAPVKEMLMTEPIVGSKAEICHPASNGGTRHLSAAQFIHDQHGAMALIASQDGRFTIFSWSPCENMVQAHRIETLLL